MKLTPAQIEVAHKVLFYEIGMFEYLWDVIRDGGSDLYNEIDLYMRNAIVESYLLRLRTLVDIFLSRGGHEDDIRLCHLIPEKSVSSLVKLRSKYGDSRTEGSCSWSLNKMLAHPTLNRSDCHNYADVIRALCPLIKAVIAELRTKPQFNAVFEEVEKNLNSQTRRPL